MTDRENPGEGAPAGAAGVRPGGGDQGATFEGETTGPGGDTSPAVTSGDVDPGAQQVVTDLYNPDGERQDDADVTPEPMAENVAAIDVPLKPDSRHRSAERVRVWS